MHPALDLSNCSASVLWLGLVPELEEDASYGGQRHEVAQWLWPGHRRVERSDDVYGRRQDALIPRHHRWVRDAEPFRYIAW